MLYQIDIKNFISIQLQKEIKMLEDIREKSQGMTAKIILGLIILTFAIAGVGNYSNSVDTSVAVVNGEKISQQAFNKAYQAQRNRMAKQFGEMFDTLSADKNYMANFRQGVLDNLINETLIDQSTNDLLIKVSDQRLKQTIRDMPEFHVNGQFDNNRYLAVINQAGFFQASDFRDYLRVEMTRRQLSQALVATEFNLPYQEKLQLTLQNQTRDIRFAIISADQFKTGLEVSEDEIKAYYLVNQARFENKEQVKIDYISLNVLDIAKGINVTEEDIKRYYQENITSFRQEEQHRFSHILIEFGDDETAAKLEAEDILAKLENSESFEVLAKTLSHDIFTNENGGDLDWLERGVMDSEFDDAAFALANIGDISPIIKTSFGYHIIKLTDFKAEVTQSFEEVKAKLETKVSNEKAQEKFYSLQQEMARISFEFPDSLDDAANEVNVEIKTSNWLSRSGNEFPFDHPKVIDAAFSDLVLQDNMNSDLIEVNDELAMVLRLNTYQEANVKPLDDVKSQITALLVAQKATDKADSTVKELLAQLKLGNDINESLAELSSEFIDKDTVARYSADVDQSIVRKAFVLPHPKNGVVSVSSVALSNGDLALIEVKSVNVDELATSADLSKQQISQLAQSAYKSYVDSLKVGAEISRSKLTEAANTY